MIKDVNDEIISNSIMFQPLDSKIPDEIFESSSVDVGIVDLNDVVGCRLVGWGRLTSVALRRGQTLAQVGRSRFLVRSEEHGVEHFVLL